MDGGMDGGREGSDDDDNDDDDDGALHNIWAVMRHKLHELPIHTKHHQCHPCS